MHVRGVGGLGVVLGHWHVARAALSVGARLLVRGRLCVCLTLTGRRKRQERSWGVYLRRLLVVCVARRRLLGNKT